MGDDGQAPRHTPEPRPAPGEGPARRGGAVRPGWGRRAVVVGAFALALAACARAPLPVLSPAELPFHIAEEFGFVLHWRVERAETTVAAAGVVEVAAPRRYLDVLLELRGLDASGQVVSRRRGRVGWPGVSPARLWPFRIEVRPQGSERRFELRLVGATPWEVPQPGR